MPYGDGYQTTTYERKGGGVPPFLWIILKTFLDDSFVGTTRVSVGEKGKMYVISTRRS
jgi:hypothetical protein